MRAEVLSLGEVLIGAAVTAIAAATAGRALGDPARGLPQFSSAVRAVRLYACGTIAIFAAASTIAGACDLLFAAAAFVERLSPVR